MAWKTKGFIFKASGQHDWMISHASHPVAMFLSDSIYRVFFSCRNINKRSSIGFVDIDLIELGKILQISEQPCLAPGAEGRFDDRGITVGSICQMGEETRLYYLGWNDAENNHPFRNRIGMATLDKDGCRFSPIGSKPVLDLNCIDPLTLSYPWVIFENDRFKMWYGTHLS